MKKILSAFDGLKYSVSTQDYSLDLAHKLKAHVVAVFQDDREYHGYKIYDLITEDGVSEKLKKELDQQDRNRRKASAEKLDAAFKQGKLQFTVHHDKNNALKDLLHESIYADLLVINGSESFKPRNEKAPTSFIRHLLEDVQCPVIVVPSKFKAIEQVVVLYDGQPVSVFALKMFNYIFGENDGSHVEILSISTGDQSMHTPDSRFIKEYLKRQLPKTKYTVLKGYPDEQIVNHLKEKPAGTLVVLGAYRRGKVSRWFRESMADVLMSELKLPLFIAHNR